MFRCSTYWLRTSETDLQLQVQLCAVRDVVILELDTCLVIYAPLRYRALILFWLTWTLDICISCHAQLSQVHESYINQNRGWTANILRILKLMRVWLILVCFEKESPRCSPPCSYLIFRPSGSCSASLQKNLFYGKTHLDFDFNMISMFLAHIVKTPSVNKRSPSATAVQIVFHLHSQHTWVRRCSM